MASSPESNSPIPCPVCHAKEIQVSHLDPLELQELSITLPSTGETISFKTATKTFMQQHYPDLQTSSYRVPAAFFYDHKGDLDLETNDEILASRDCIRARGSATRYSTEVVIDRFQKDAVEKVVRRFHTWSAGRGEGMMILSEYKMQNYLRLATKSAGCKKRKNLVGDHDVMAIHYESGVVVFVQVKSAQKTSAWKTIRGKLRNAWEQTIKDEGAFRELNADMGDSISKVHVLRLVALPELSSSHLTSMGVCDYHIGSVLTRETLESVSVFDKWISEHITRIKQEKGVTRFSVGTYTELCGRYVGLASVVRIRTMPEAVRKASAKTGKILLSPEQKEIILAGSRRQIIMGEYGTGKSLVLAKMAEKIVGVQEGDFCVDEDLKKNTVFIVSCSSVSHTRTMGRLRRSPCHLVAHLKNLVYDQSSALKIMSVGDLFLYCYPELNPYFRRFDPATMSELTRKVMSMHPEMQMHIFWDEVPFVPKWDWNPLHDLAVEHPETFIWVTIATGTYTTMDPVNPTACVSKKIPANFDISHLKRCMRMTRNGFNLYRTLQEYLGDKGCSATVSGNAVHGGIPLWYSMPDCACNTSEPLDCSCIQTRLTRCLQRAWGLLNGINLSQVSIVVRDSEHHIDKFLFANVEQACRSLDIPAEQCPSTDNPPTPDTPGENTVTPKCQIVDIFSYKGCESPVVIFITPYGWPLVWDHRSGRHGWDDISPQISRALGQIIIVTWPKNEMDHFSRVAVLNMISSYSLFPQPVDSEEEAEFLKMMKEKFDEVLNLYSGNDRHNYLDFLVDRGLDEMSHIDNRVPNTT